MTSEFTFCICTYNSERTLERCLSSIRGLSENSRVIVLDHNSNDRTLEIAARYDASLEKENTGLGFARQRCLDLADTKYIVFVDSDVE
ncbi:MAG: glycosyltransferase family 2 protein, partial [Thaumarchaeota archaeon]|nr:glycosyltransferase family 2 protein [Nitrososphaerota archaeon]